MPTPRKRTHCHCLRYLLALQDRFSEAWAFLNSLQQPGFANAESKHVSELYLLAYLSMSHPDNSELASVPAIMEILRRRCVRPEWARRIDVLQEQLSESFEDKARPPSSSDLLRMRPHSSKTVQTDAFAFSVKVRNEAKTFVDLIASGLTAPSTARIKIFQLDIEVIFSKDPFLVAGRDNSITAGSMFAAVVPHAVIEEILEPSSAGDSAVTVCKVVELPSLQSSSCFFLAVECNGIKSGQTVFKRLVAPAVMVLRAHSAIVTLSSNLFTAAWSLLVQSSSVLSLSSTLPAVVQRLFFHRRLCEQRCCNVDSFTQCIRQSVHQTQKRPHRILQGWLH